MNPMKRFTDSLRDAASDVWDAQHAHPFVCGIGDGSLNVEKFKHWIRQDYLFLIDYARLLSIASARAPDLDTARRFAELAHSTLSHEMDLHRAYAAEFGISHADLEAEPKAPATHAYTDFLLRTATLGDYPELLAALLPCMWGFSEIGLRLAQLPRPPDSRYAAWIDMYADPEFTTLAAWCRDLTDRTAEGLSAHRLQHLEEVFIESSRHELAFWEMAWRFDPTPQSAP